jgi:hypothetical protein
LQQAVQQQGQQVPQPQQCHECAPPPQALSANDFATLKQHLQPQAPNMRFDMLLAAIKGGTHFLASQVCNTNSVKRLLSPDFGQAADVLKNSNFTPDQRKHLAALFYSVCTDKANFYLVLECFPIESGTVVICYHNEK